MASSKNLFLLFGILLALLFLISSHVAASHDETSESVEIDGKRGGRGYGYPGKGYGGGRYPGHGGGKGGSYPGKGGGYPGKGCRYGCCKKYKYGKGCKCCATADEVPDAEFEDDVRT